MDSREKARPAGSNVAWQSPVLSAVVVELR